MSRQSELAQLGRVFDSGPLSNRNLIINGAMQVAQRGTSATGVTSGGYYAVDRFRTNYNGSPDQLVVTQEQSTDAPTGFANSYKLTITTAETTLDADERVGIQQRIEGQNLQHLNYGTSNAQSLTLSFYVKSNVTGTYGLLVENRNALKSIGFTYTINAANTWEKKTITIPGDTASAMTNDNNESLRLLWTLAAGTDFTSGTYTSSWQANVTANEAPSSQVNLVDTVSNYWQITGVQLEVGDTETPFEHRSYAQELSLCQRYYWQQTSAVQGSKYQTMIGARSTGVAICDIPLVSTMRAGPTITGSNITQTGLGGDPNSITSTVNSTNNVLVFFDGAFTANNVGNVVFDVTLDAEL